MDVRCFKCKSKLSEVEEFITIQSEKPIAKFKIKCKKCKVINSYFIPYCFNKTKNK